MGLDQEMPEITPQQLEAYKKKLEEQQVQAMKNCIAQLQEISSQAGFTIVAVPQLQEDGRITATWGLRRKS